MANATFRNGPVLGAAVFGLLLCAGLLYWQQARSQAFVAESRLDTARAVQGLVEQQIKQDLDARAELIAGNQAFIGYITQAMGGILPGTLVDTASIVDLLEERRAQLGLTIAAVIDGQGQLIASRDRISERHSFASDSLFAQAVTSNSTAHGLWVDGERVFFVAMVPLAAYGSDAGFLFVGTALDDDVAAMIGKTADAEVALFAIDGQRRVLAAKSVDASADLQALSGEPQATGADGRFATRQARGYVAPLFGSPAGELVVAVRSESAWAGAFTQGLPLLIGLGLGLAAMFLSVRLSNSRVARQAQELARVVDHAATTGDYHLQVAESEAGMLQPVAAAFNRLMQRLSPRET